MHTSTATLVDESLAGIKKVMSEGWALCVASSFGKDSSVLLNLTMTAARECVAEGIKIHPVVVSHADTGVDAPEMRQLANSEIDKLKRYAATHGIPLRVDVVRPGAFSTWPAKVIGGRGLPTFEDSGSRDCTIDLKITPQQRQRKRIMRELKSTGTPLTLLGVRLEESPDRAQRMLARGDSATEPQNQNGEWMLSPIMHFDQEAIWTYLSQCQSGVIDSYSDFQDLTRIYADSAGTSCFVVGDDVTAALKSKRACGARTGCHTCNAVGAEDRSMSAMIETDDRYAYLKPLADFRQFTRATRFDLNRRNWIMRSIENDEIRLMPDAYSPDMVEEMLRIALTIDIRESSRAARAGEPGPKFQIITPEDLVAIDFQWSRYGIHAPFHALKIYMDVSSGEFTDIPQIPDDAYPKPKGLSAVKGVIPVRFDFDKQDGLSSWMHEGFASECGFSAKSIGNTTVTDYGTSQSVEIDPEGVEMFLVFEAERMIAEYHRTDIDPTIAARIYLQYGTVTLSPKGTSDNEKIVRRTQAMWRAGFTGQHDPAHLLSMAAEALAQNKAFNEDGVLVDLPSTPNDVDAFDAHLQQEPIRVETHALLLSLAQSAKTGAIESATTAELDEEPVEPEVGENLRFAF